MTDPVPTNGAENTPPPTGVRAATENLFGPPAPPAAGLHEPLGVPEAPSPPPSPDDATSQSPSVEDVIDGNGGTLPPPPPRPPVHGAEPPRPMPPDVSVAPPPPPPPTEMHIKPIVVPEGAPPPPPPPNREPETPADRAAEKAIAEADARIAEIEEFDKDKSRLAEIHESLKAASKPKELKAAADELTKFVDEAFSEIDEAKEPKAEEPKIDREVSRLEAQRADIQKHIDAKVAKGEDADQLNAYLADKKAEILAAKSRASVEPETGKSKPDKKEPIVVEKEDKAEALKEVQAKVNRLIEELADNSISSTGAEPTPEQADKILEYVRAVEERHALGGEGKLGISVFEAETAKERLIGQKAIALYEAKRDGKDTAEIIKDFNARIERMGKYSRRAEHEIDLENTPANIRLDSVQEINPLPPIKGQEPIITPPKELPPLPDADPLPMPDNPRNSENLDLREIESKKEQANLEFNQAMVVFAKANVTSEGTLSGPEKDQALKSAEEQMHAKFEALIDAEIVVELTNNETNTKLRDSVEDVTLAGDYQAWSEHRLEQLRPLMSLPEDERPAGLEAEIAAQEEYLTKIQDWTTERRATITELEAQSDAEVAAIKAAKRNNRLMNIDQEIDKLMIAERADRHPWLNKINKHLIANPKARKWIGGALLVAGVVATATGLVPLAVGVFSARAAMGGIGAYNLVRGHYQGKADTAMAETQKGAVAEASLAGITGARVEHSKEIRSSKRKAVGAGVVTTGALIALGMWMHSPTDIGHRVGSVNQFGPNGELQTNQGLFGHLSPEQLARSRAHWTSLLSPREVAAIGPDQAGVFDHLNNAAQMKIPFYLHDYLPGLAARA